MPGDQETKEEERIFLFSSGFVYALGGPVDLTLTEFVAHLDARIHSLFILLAPFTSQSGLVGSMEEIFEWLRGSRLELASEIRKAYLQGCQPEIEIQEDESTIKSLAGCIYAKAAIEVLEEIFGPQCRVMATRQLAEIPLGSQVASGISAFSNRSRDSGDLGFGKPRCKYVPYSKLVASRGHAYSQERPSEGF